MIIVLKSLTACCCLIIASQDFKERAVLWILFPILSLLLAFLHYWNTTATIFWIDTVINSCLVTLILTVLYLYCKLIAREIFINHSFGMGDLLFFYAFGLGFPTITFVVLFAFSIVFSLVVYFVAKRSLGLSTVPLAGLMALFLIFILAFSLFFDSNFLYRY